MPGNYFPFIATETSAIPFPLRATVLSFQFSSVRCSVFSFLASMAYPTQPTNTFGLGLSLRPTSCCRRTPLLSGSTKCSSLLGDLAACARVERKVFLRFSICQLVGLPRKVTLPRNHIFFRQSFVSKKKKKPKKKYMLWQSIIMAKMNALL